MQCIYFNDKECESTVINDKQCHKCLILKNMELFKELNERITALENPTTKKTGRTGKAKMVG